MKKIFLLAGTILPVLYLHAQLNISSGTTVNLGAKTFLVVSGDLVSKSTITGTGTIVMRGTALQKMNLNGLTIPSLTIYNASNVQLTGSAGINSLLKFTLGKIIAGNYYLMLRNNATTSGAGAGKFVETNGTGELQKQVSSNLTSFLLPVGNKSNYTPATVTTSATYSSAMLGIRARGAVHPAKPATATSYLNTYWSITRPGIKGSVIVAATYLPSNVAGTESALAAAFYNGSTFSTVGSSINTSTNIITVPTPSNGDVYALSSSGLKMMNAFKNGVTEPSLSPNPVKRMAMLSLPVQVEGTVMITVTDVGGRTVMTTSKTFSPGIYRQQLDLGQLSEGVYQVRVQSAGLDHTFSIIKK